MTETATDTTPSEDTETPEPEPDPADDQLPQNGAVDDKPSPEGPQPEAGMTRAERRKAQQDEKARQQRDEATARAEAAEARLAQHDREAAQRMASKLVDPTDLWRAGVTVEELRDAEGNLDPDLVAQAVARIAAEHPHWTRSVAAPASLVTDGATTPKTSGNESSFVDAFKPKDVR